MDVADGDVLEYPVSLCDLIKGGAKFEINTNFEENVSTEFFDDLGAEGSDDEDDEKFHEIRISPWEKSFDELRAHMTKINENIYKKVIEQGDSDSELVPERARVCIDYSAYFEKELAPFDSSFMRGETFVFQCGEHAVLEGLEEAVRTMRKGEEAQFLLSYKLLFSEIGCPPRIKPKADGLFIIKLINFTNVGDENAIEKIPEEDRNKFSVVFDKVKEVHVKAIDYFKHKQTRRACRLFHKAVHTLSFCRLSNDEEEAEQQEFLVKLYVNLAVCYNILKLPLKVCCMCNEIRKISNINGNCKALFQEGRALFAIGEYERAKIRLTQAKNLNPNNKEITNELISLAEKYEVYKRNEKSIWRKAMGIINKTENKENEAESSNVHEEIYKILKSFKENDDIKKLSLPDGLSTNEIKSIDNLTTEFGLKLNICDVPNHRSYFITKLQVQEQ